MDEYRIVRPDGTAAWLESTISVEFDGHVMMRGLVRDVTDRKRAEESLRDSEERYKALFERMSEGFFLAEIICDDSGRPVDYRYLAANPALERVTGIKWDSIRGKTRNEIVSGPDLWIKTFGRVALSGKPETFEGFSVALNRHFSISAFSPRRGQFAGLVEDITNRKEAEKALKESEERFRSLFENSPDAIFLAIPGGPITHANPAACAIFRLTEEELRLAGRKGMMAKGPPLNSGGYQPRAPGSSLANRRVSLIVTQRAGRVSDLGKGDKCVGICKTFAVRVGGQAIRRGVMG